MRGGNQILNGTTLVIVIALIVAVLFPQFAWDGYMFPALLLAGALFLFGYLLIAGKKLNRKVKWAIILSIIAWLFIAYTVSPEWGLFARLF
jgi:hypothetical protein